MSTGQAAGRAEPWAMSERLPSLRACSVLGTGHTPVLCPLSGVTVVTFRSELSPGTEIQGMQCWRGSACWIHPFHLPWVRMCPLLNKKKSFAAGKSVSNWQALAAVSVLFLFLFCVRGWSSRVCVLQGEAELWVGSWAFLIYFIPSQQSPVTWALDMQTVHWSGRESSWMLKCFAGSEPECPTFLYLVPRPLGWLCMWIIASQPCIFESVSCSGIAQKKHFPLMSRRTLTASINSLWCSLERCLMPQQNVSPWGIAF